MFFISNIHTGMEMSTNFIINNSKFNIIFAKKKNFLFKSENYFLYNKLTSIVLSKKKITLSIK